MKYEIRAGHGPTDGTVTLSSHFRFVDPAQPDPYAPGWKDVEIAWSDTTAVSDNVHYYGFADEEKSDASYWPM